MRSLKLSFINKKLDIKQFETLHSCLALCGGTSLRQFPKIINNYKKWNPSYLCLFLPLSKTSKIVARRLEARVEWGGLGARRLEARGGSGHHGRGQGWGRGSSGHDASRLREWGWGASGHDASRLGMGFGGLMARQGWGWGPRGTARRGVGRRGDSGTASRSGPRERRLEARGWDRGASWHNASRLGVGLGSGTMPRD
ncbi:hypothetical protein H5410_002338 [Solanum commersonii]|uniref:Uncharacterized protein n=1 Tax=Solanum commersonii TaxID=4109 RepID=A0A9J6B1G6_SOLCO|nr:hypothetical protein H5410_002338 [Solanum commersonii]